MHFSPLILFGCTLLTIITDSDAVKRRKRTFDVRKNSKQCHGTERKICEEISNYPSEKITKLLNANPDLYRNAFGEIIRTEQLDSLNTRLPLGAETNLCETRKYTVYPKSADDLEFIRRIIVNDNNNVQSVTFETCASTKCSQIESSVALGIQTSCKQVYSTVRLLYLNDTNHLEYGQFPIPSTCVCMYQKPDWQRIN